jgi:hypothetical protein
VPQCCKLRPTSLFMLKATICRVIRVRPKLTVRHRHSTVLLDDSAPVADRSAPPPDDKASHADGSQSVRTSGNSQDSKAPPAHDDDAATKSQEEANVDGIRSEENAVECKVGANAKVIHCASPTDDGKSAGDDKPAENKETDNLVPASLPVESVETNIRVDAIAAVTTPAPQSEHGQIPQLPEQAAPAAHSQHS